MTGEIVIFQFDMDHQQEIALWKMHAKASEARDACRRAADIAEEQRKAAWRQYYKICKEMREIEEKLDLDPDFFESFPQPRPGEIFVTPPMGTIKPSSNAPKKRKITQEETFE